jgi:hypothetical protein
MMFFRKNLLAVLAALLAAATIAHAITWVRTYGDEGNEGGFCVQITKDGNYIITGYPWVLIKVDTSGKVLWSRDYGISGRWGEQVSDGGYIITSSVPSLLRTNSQGDTLWSRNYELDSYCVQETSDSDYIMVGDHYEGNEKYLVLLKTDFDGALLWTRTYGAPSHNRNSGFFIQETSDGDYIITGATGIDTEEFATGYLWLIKTDADGDTLWTQEYGTGEIGTFNKGYCVKETRDGGYIITGYKDYEGLWLLKTDIDGDTLWTKTYTTPAGGTGYNVQETQDSGFIVVGNTETLTALSNGANRNLWLIKTDKEGDTLWTRIYGGDGYDEGYCVQQLNDLGYLVVGATTSYGVGGSYDLWLLRTDSLGLLGITEPPLSQESLSWGVASSLGSQIILYYFNRPQGVRASIFDASGRKVGEVYSRESTGILTWGANQPSGVYFLQVIEDKDIIKTERIVLIH